MYNDRNKIPTPLSEFIVLHGYIRLYNVLVLSLSIDKLRFWKKSW